MTLSELLALMRLLSALESWSMATQHRLPDYLDEQLRDSVAMLEREILKGVTP
jgi:hypothetical protein